MDIHPPSGPTHSFKDFAIHILIVTIGILIALGLEGVRENWREQRAVADARESFRRELRIDRSQLALEMKSVEGLIEQSKRALSLLPGATHIPPAASRAVADLEWGDYFLRTNAWESFSAGGALAHMNEQELSRFEEAYLSVKYYQDAQKSFLPDWIAARAWFESHRSWTAADEAIGEEKLRVLGTKAWMMQHIGTQLGDSLQAAIGN
jgi:hypothetical protein